VGAFAVLVGKIRLRGSVSDRGYRLDEKHGLEPGPQTERNVNYWEGRGYLGFCLTPSPRDESKGLNRITTETGAAIEDE